MVFCPCPVHQHKPNPTGRRADHRHRQKIRRSHDVGHECIQRGAVDRLRRPLLADHTVAHHQDAVGQRQSLRLIMRHIDGGDVQLALQLADFRAGLVAQLGVQIGQRFIEQQHRRRMHDRPRHRHALLLPARQLLRRPVAERAQPDHGQGLGDPRFDLGVGAAADAQREGHVLEHRQMRPNGIGLEHHADIAVIGLHNDPGFGIEDHHVVDRNEPGFRRFQPRDAAQRRGLAAAGGTEQRHQLPLRDLEADAIDDGLVAVAFDQIADDDAHTRAPIPASWRARRRPSARR